ncbi:aspartate/glutamate racemase family protein [Paenibacillus sp. y28]|uniref:aspartate/glutamate racemase family protein n=1 Tax=Paenibacillus sp. y28 TaxID=3129110 RepID=UPI0030192E16
MKTVVAVYTGQGLADPLKAVFQEVLPGCRLVNIIDDSLIGDVVKAGQVPPGVARRLIQYFHHAEELGADVILNTCSSVGEVADAARGFIGVPIVKIDEAMAAKAAIGYDRIAVLATLPSTLEPTMRLVQKQADLAGRQVTLVNGLAEGAFDALVGGKPEEHDRILLETAKRAASDADVIVLAQGSMARMESKLREETGKPVLSSPRLGVEAVKAALELAAEQGHTA